MAASRIIFHVDMDAFYASCELTEHPEWRGGAGRGGGGKPVPVGAAPREGRGRGVVLTATYEARKFGVRSGMPISQAYRQCKDPDTVYVRPHFDLYVSTSREVMVTLQSFADVFESWGIDEAFLEVTARAGSWEGARGLAAELKAQVRERHGIPCSVGAAP